MPVLGSVPNGPGTMQMPGALAFIERVVRQICTLVWYNYANNSKGAKFGTNEADIIQINNQLGTF